MRRASLALAFAAGGRPWPAAPIVASHVLPPLVAALLAWAPTSALDRMRADVQRARRLGSYELTERLGAGGMDEVWRANHQLLARPAAIELVSPELLGAKDARSREMLIQRFEKEAQVTASLESPHSVELYDFGVSSDGVLFYVMELLHGMDLETLVQRFGALPPERVLHLLAQACDSLDDAHERGLIHRDITPANLFVARKGATHDFSRVLDFGLVKRWDAPPDAAASSLGEGSPLRTAVGQIAGTPAFLAPEAVLGEGSIDRRVALVARARGSVVAAAFASGGQGP